MIMGKGVVGYFCVCTIGDKIDVTHRGSVKPEFILLTEEDLKKMAEMNPNLHYDNDKLWERFIDDRHGKDS